MARNQEYRENSTVRWVPGFLRDFLGLSSTFEKPSYDKYGGTSADHARSTTEWIPGLIRRWLGLEYTEPKRYGPSEPDDGGDYRGGYLAPPPPARSYSPPPARDYSAPPARDYSPPPARDYAAPQPTRMSFGKGSADYRAPRLEGAYAPPARNEPAGSGPGDLTPTGEEMPARFDTDVQSVGYLVRAYIRGALPPQGLEAFTREASTTLKQVGDLYSHWVRFQTAEMVEMARGIASSINPPPVTPVTPPTPRAQPEPAAATTTAAEVKVKPAEAPPAPAAATMTAAEVKVKPAEAPPAPEAPAAAVEPAKPAMEAPKTPPAGKTDKK